MLVDVSGGKGQSGRGLIAREVLNGVLGRDPKDGGGS